MTTLTEIAPDTYRISTYVDPPGLVFDQFLVTGEEPLLFHTGPRAMFSTIADSLRIFPPLNELRWITFGHLEADECGWMNQWLAAAPDAQVAHGLLGCSLSVNDMADRPPRPLADGEVIDIGGTGWAGRNPARPARLGRRAVLRRHRQHLLYGDLFTALGTGPAITDAELVGPALAAADLFNATCLTPHRSDHPIARQLGPDNPRTDARPQLPRRLRHRTDRSSRRLRRAPPSRGCYPPIQGPHCHNHPYPIPVKAAPTPARRIGPHTLRSLDAVHLAPALVVGPPRCSLSMCAIPCAPLRCMTVAWAC